MTTALYLRVSTDHQSDRHGLDAQRAACMAYADRHGLTVAREYVDVYSGTSEVRAALTDLLTEAHQYQHVLTYSVDRIAREVPAAYHIVQQWQRLGLQVHTTLDGVVNLDDDADALKFGVNAIFADMERRKIVARTHAGRIARGKKGLPPNGVKAYGYRTDKNTNEIQPHPEEAPVVRRIFELSPTMTLLGICKLLNDEQQLPRSGIWWPTVIRGIVRNPIYKGQYQYGGAHTRRTKTPINISVPAIVDETTWLLAQRPIGVTRRNVHGFHLKGHITCTACGSSYTPHISRTKRKNNSVYEYSMYRCTRMSTPRGPCGNPNREAGKTHAAVELALREIISTPERLREALGQQQVAQHVDVHDLEEQDREAFKAWRDKVITTEELGLIRRELEQERQRRQAGPATERNITGMWETAQTLSFPELITYLGVRVLVKSDGLEVTVSV